MTELRDKRIAVVGVELMGGLLLDRLLAAESCSKEQIIAWCAQHGRWLRGERP